MIVIRERGIEIYQDVLEKKIRRFPDNFFLGEEGKKYIRYMTCYLLEERLSIPVHEIPLKVAANTLWSHRLKPPAMMYGWNYYDVIDNAYPGIFKPWEFRQVPRKYWYGKEGRNRAIEAIKYVIKKELKIPIEEISLQVNFHFFKKYRLNGVFDLFGQSPFQVIEAVYPGIFKTWQFAHVPMNCWKDQVYIQEQQKDKTFDSLQYSGLFHFVERLQLTSYTLQHS
jgi:hypothetical protein